MRTRSGFTYGQINPQTGYFKTGVGAAAIAAGTYIAQRVMNKLVNRNVVDPILGTLPAPIGAKKRRAQLRSEAKLTRQFGARLGGRFRKGKRVRLFPKKRKYKGVQGYQKKLQKFQNAGALVTREAGISTNGVSDSVYIGHCTYARHRWLDALARAILRKLMNVMAANGGRARNWTDALAPLGVDVSDQFSVFWKQGVDSTVTMSQSTYSVPGTGNPTWDDVVTWWYNGLEGITGERDVFFSHAEYIDNSTGKRYEVDLANATIDIYVKSSLKLQNTTISTAGAEADEVDNVPISGKSYEGRGSGTLSNRTVQYSYERNLFGDSDIGYIQKTGSLSNGMSEMPPAGYFRNVKKIQTQRIDPGKIKYSNLVTNMTISLFSLANGIFKNSANSTSQISNFGRFKIFGFEHVIKAKSDAPQIRIFGEINYRIGMYITLKGCNTIDEKATQAYYTY